MARVAKFRSSHIQRNTFARYSTIAYLYIHVSIALPDYLSFIPIPVITACLAKKVLEGRSKSRKATTRMQLPTEPSRSITLDVEDLEADPAPSFIIKVGTSALDFEFLYANEAFRTRGFRDAVLAQDRVALIFRTWAQALSQSKESEHEFAGRTWSAEVAVKSGALKLIRATRAVSEELFVKDDCESGLGKEVFDQLAKGRSRIYKPSKDEVMGYVNRDGMPLLQKVPHTNLNARWEGIQTMMEMSDVGVFEYTTDGILLNANEAFYRLRLVQLIYA